MNIEDPRIALDLVPSGSVAVVFAKDQPQYQPLPSVVTPSGTLITRWSLTDDEKRCLLAGEDVFLTVLYALAPCAGCGHRPTLSPVQLEVGASHWLDC